MTLFHVKIQNILLENKNHRLVNFFKIFKLNISNKKCLIFGGPVCYFIQNKT